MSRESTSGPACVWNNAECEGTPYCPPRCPRFIDYAGSACVVRLAESADRKEIVDMYDRLDVYSRTMGIPPTDRPRIESWIERLLADGWNLVAVADSIVIGHVVVIPADSETPQFLIFVDDEYQNRGVGTELIKQLIAYADERDHERLTLDVSTGNDRAITVYRNVGFEVVERMRTELEMELPLRDSLTNRLRRPPADREHPELPEREN